MHIDTAGTYTLKYTAEDACGNVTEVEREVEAVQISYRTVLYTDGTLIINEKSTDIDANVAEHGAATNVYDPFDPNGNTSVKKYIFNSSQVLWRNQNASIKAAEVGSFIKVPSLANWFISLSNCISIDLSNVDASDVTSIASLCNGCSQLTALTLPSVLPTALTNGYYAFNDCRSLGSLDLSGIGIGTLLQMQRMFKGCEAMTSLILPEIPQTNNLELTFSDCRSLTSLDLTKIRSTSPCTTMESTFSGCKAPQLDVSHFDTRNVTTMRSMFRTVHATVLDLSGFNTSSVTDMYWMFSGASLLQTIYASSDFVTDQVTNSSSMFNGNSNLVGGAGTVYSSNNPTDKTYAHIDGGTADPGYFTLKSA